MDLLDRIKTLEPEYDKFYYQFILDFTIEQGGRTGRSTEEEKWERGKYFSTRYEMYMYATLLGMKKGYEIPLEKKGKERKSFIKIDSWKPSYIADYIIMGILGLGDYDLFQMEQMDEEELQNTISNIKKDIEKYANGGLDIIKSKAEEDDTFFVENENSFIDLLDE